MRIILDQSAVLCFRLGGELDWRFLKSLSSRTIMFRSYGDALSDEYKWGRFATAMSYFHDHFKSSFSKIHELADGPFRDRGMTLQMYLREAEALKKHLEGHHTIEERYIFPELAKKMPSFAMDEQHLKSHEGIHDGLVRLSSLIHEFKENPSTYSPQRMRDCLDSFRDVLMKHLDEEVADLQPDNLKKYWTLEELERIPIPCFISILSKPTNGRTLPVLHLHLLTFFTSFPYRVYIWNTTAWSLTPSLRLSCFSSRLNTDKLRSRSVGEHGSSLYTVLFFT
ncbi:hypothetical protein PNOK_0525400 [Pyrrhoderma noxium]|uniref:Hemerythrin-like domain-containing protein n=1 Tax=Pyrrhoderma noxium TaxID=2282107 RepID=A0A286UFL5_9AGAM|nr:hypothetical protein PNOK_0525400 [Pyrrhoderma noxium]